MLLQIILSNSETTKGGVNVMGKIMKKLNTFNICAIVVIASILLLAIMASIWSDVNNTTDYILKESISTDASHKITVIADDNPQWPFGPQSISIKIDDNKTVLKTLVFNDGGKAIALIEWLDNDTASLVLRGKEQRDCVYEIKFEEDYFSVGFKES